MPLFKRPDRPTLKPRRPPTHVKPGDRVKVVGTRSPQAGRSGRVVRVAGASVVVELDRPYMIAGQSRRLFYSYAGELEEIPRVGRMGAQDLFADDEE